MSVPNYVIIQKNKQMYELYGTRSCTVVASGSKYKMLKLLNNLNNLDDNKLLTKPELEDRMLYGE